MYLKFFFSSFLAIFFLLNKQAKLRRSLPGNLFLIILFLSSLPVIQPLSAFCGFYVARADAKLFNEASRVVLVRDKQRTVVGMMNDYQGELRDFALVIPVPSLLKRKQIHIGDPAIFNHLDAYTAPRLVEYHDNNPCRRRYDPRRKRALRTNEGMNRKDSESSKNSSGVTIEAAYTIGEYDIKILSAKYSRGLETWLRQNRYKIPEGAAKALKPYIQQKMKFFVARVNLKEKRKTGLNYLRPIQFAYESEKFMLPIRLGMLNASGKQELLIYVLTKNGRVETTNYRTVKLPSNLELPQYIKSEFGSFYKAMFDYQAKKYQYRAVFTEYFWNMNWCDPCAANPLSQKELKSLGVFWLSENNLRSQAQNVVVSRLHLKYDNQSFPEDLMFQQTNDKQNFQGRYIIRHPWNGNRNACRAAERYFSQLATLQENRAKNLARITGWPLEKIHKKMGFQSNRSSSSAPEWWQNIWN